MVRRRMLPSLSRAITAASSTWPTRLVARTSAPSRPSSWTVRARTGAVVSLNGYIADENDDVGPLFDWYGNGHVEWTWSEGQDPCRTTAASRDFVKAMYTRIGAVVIGRRLFDHTDGWGGVPAAGD